jgi:hypothetical protein
MKKIVILSLSCIGLTTLVAFNEAGNFVIEKFNKNEFHKNSGGAGTEKTGAPGEQNCTACHAGTAQDGSGENILTLLSGATPVTTYVPGNTYTVALAMSSNPSKKGFQATVLDASGNMAGDFTSGANTNVVAGTSRKYANHTSLSNTSATTLWGWSWQAPSTNVGNITFYVATNSANGNGNNGGDLIYLSQHIFSPSSGAGIEEESANESNFSAGYSESTNSIVLTCNSMVSGNMSVNIVDMNGKLIISQQLGKSLPGIINEKVSLPTDLKTGMYIVNFFIDNNAYSSPILVK